MKVLDTSQFVSERMKFKPVTNAEWERVKQETESSLIKPGDKLKDRDLVLVACDQLDGSEVEIQYTYYDDTINYLIYQNSTGLSYDLLKDTFSYTYNKYTHYILKIYRQETGLRIGKMTISGDYKNVDKKLKNDPDCKCIYCNHELLKKFNVE